MDQFLKRQSLVSYAHARHSRVVLNLGFNYALRHDALHRNPVAGTARLKQPVSKPGRTETLDELQLVRQADASWRNGPSVSGPRPDWQVKGVIEVMLGNRDRIGVALALRTCDVDDTVSPCRSPWRACVS